MINAYPQILFAMTFLLKSGAFDPETPFKVVDQMSGSDSLVEVAKVLVVKGQDGWTQVWQQHRETAVIGGPGGPPTVGPQSDRPAVDFSKNVVLCVFGGQSRNVSGFSIAAAGEYKGTIIVRLQPVLLPTSGSGVLQNPYIMVVLPRTKKKMQVQLDQSQLGGKGWSVLGDFGPTSEDRN